MNILLILALLAIINLLAMALFPGLRPSGSPVRVEMGEMSHNDGDDRYDGYCLVIHFFGFCFQIAVARKGSQ